MGIMTVLVKRIEMRDVEMRLYPKYGATYHPLLPPPPTEIRSAVLNDSDVSKPESDSSAKEKPVQTITKVQNKAVVFILFSYGLKPKLHTKRNNIVV